MDLVLAWGSRQQAGGFDKLHTARCSSASLAPEIQTPSVMIR